MRLFRDNEKGCSLHIPGYILPASAITWSVVWPGLYNGQPSPLTCSQYWHPTAQLYLWFLSCYPLCWLVQCWGGSAEWLGQSVTVRWSPIEVGTFHFSKLFPPCVATIVPISQIHSFHKKPSGSDCCLLAFHIRVRCGLQSHPSFHIVWI